MKTLNGVVVALAIGTIASVSGTGCNTISGAGKDIQAGGRGVEHAADDAHDGKKHRDNRHHTITASAERGGSISPAGRVSLHHGSDRTYRINAYSGHHVTDVMVDGRSVGAVDQYRFNDVTTNHTIDALFDSNRGH